jgi:20S proteasome subunit beta 4
MVIKFDFNCILIDKNGIHNIDLASADPLSAVNQPESAVDAPNPPVEVGA